MSFDMNSAVLFCDSSELDLIKTFECGQCFRWNADDEGVYTGVAFGYAAKLAEIDGKIYIDSDAPMSVWHDYFDIDTDYAAVTASFDCGDYLKECCEFGCGIRILKQEKWEALCSFIISQCNNIPRIKKIVETLCREFGDEIDFRGEKHYSFPDPVRLAVLTEADLAPLRSGYRAEYIIIAAKAVVNGTLDLDSLSRMRCTDALKALKSIRGIGEKVANCVVLFGLHIMDAFPIDVWMKRALKEHFPPDFDPEVLGPYAGLAQQYIFYHARSGGN